MRNVLLALGVVGALALTLVTWRTRPERGGSATPSAVEELAPGGGDTPSARTEPLELDANANAREEPRSIAGEAQVVPAEPDWQWLLAHRCAKKGTTPTEEQHWLERYARLGRGRARLRANPSAWNAVDVLALAVETQLDVRGRFVTSREAALAAQPDLILHSGPRQYPIRRGEFPLLDELHALWRESSTSKQPVSAANVQRVTAEVEAALAEALSRVPEASLRRP